MDELRIALVGAGIFARDAHAPALNSLRGRARAVAVWSRTRQSAEACAGILGEGAEAVTDLDALLSREDIDAVDVVLPIDAQPEVIRRALAAGKHVISEKPVAPNSTVAASLLAEWRSSGRVWMVAENYRYEAAWLKAAELLAQGLIGKPLSVTWAQQNAMTPAIKYYHTPWRMSGQVGGGFVLDAGVHHMAVLRMLLGEIVSVKAEVAHYRADLPAPDTIASTLQFVGGALGQYFVTFAARLPGDSPLTIAGAAGTLRAQRGWVEIAIDTGTIRHEVAERAGVEAELAAFVAAVREGAPHRNTPEEALRDLQVIEAMFRSAQEGGVRVVSGATD